MKLAKSCKIGLAFLMAISTASTFGSAASAADLKALSLKDAIDLGIKVSPQMKDARTEIQKKKIELEQALHAVKGEESKASGPFAKPRSLNQDIQLRIKIPEANKQLFIAQESLGQAALTVKFEVEKAYLQGVQDQYAEAAAERKWQEAVKAVDAVKIKEKYGLSKPDELKEAAKAVETTASSWKLAQLSAKASRLALGDKIGQKLENKLELAFQPDYADLNQQMLPAYIASGQKTNLGLLQDSQDRRLADEKLNTTRNLYASKFGSGRMRVMDSMYKDKDMDLELFLASYDTTLEQIKKDWEGFFLLSGFIPIPKVLLQGEFDGLRYLDDIRSALPLAAIEQNKAVLKEKESLNSVISAVRQAYLEAKGAEESYSGVLRAKDDAAFALDKANQRYKLGLLKSSELQQAKDALTKADENILAAQIAYKTSVEKLNVDTGGAVERTLKEGILPYKNLDDGLGAVKPAKEKPPSGKWQLRPAVGPILSDFTLQASKKLKATDFALFTAKGKPIGKKTGLGKPVRNLTLLLSNPDKMKVVLYQKDKIIGEAVPSGSGSSGTLDIAAPSNADQTLPNSSGAGNINGTIIIGSYKIQMDALTPAAFNAAAATMQTTGQGMYFQADPAGPVFGMDNVVDPDALSDPSGGAALTAAEAAALKVTVSMEKPGEIKSLLTPAQIDQQIESLKKDKEKLEASKLEAITAQKLADAANTAVQIKDAEAQIAMLVALQKGDTKAALQQMAIVNNPDALISAMAQESETAAGGGTGASTGNGGAAGAPPSEEQLAAQAELAQQKLAAALAAGDAGAALEQQSQLLQARVGLADAQSGTSEAAAALGQTKAKLAAALKAAQAEQDAAKAEQLSRTLAAVTDSLLSAQKAYLFLQLEENKIDLAALQEAPAAAGSSQLALQQLQSAAELQIKQLLEQIKQLEISKYTPEELEALAQVSLEIKQSAAGNITVQPIPAGNVVSKDFFIKLPVPPVIIDGKAYLPIRPISESFGAAVDWDENNQTVTVSTEDTTVECSINSPVAYVDGEPAAIDAPPLLILGSTLVPLRFMAESLGLAVDWNAEAQTIQISLE